MTERTLQAQLDALSDVERPNNLEIAALTRYDIPALASLFLVAYETSETAENLWEATDEMRMAYDGAFGRPLDDSFLGAWLDGELVGAVMCVEEAPWDDAPPGPFVIDLMVDPKHRRHGIARALISELAGRCKQWGYDNLTLRLDMRTGFAASQLYSLLGFTEIDTDRKTTAQDRATVKL